MESKEKANWKVAIEEELNSMFKNNVWKLVDIPKFMKHSKQANIINSQWIFKCRMAKDGTTKHKARLMIRGFKD